MTGIEPSCTYRQKKNIDRSAMKQYSVISHVRRSSCGTAAKAVGTHAWPGQCVVCCTSAMFHSRVWGKKRTKFCVLKRHNRIQKYGTVSWGGPSIIYVTVQGNRVVMEAGAYIYIHILMYLLETGHHVMKANKQSGRLQQRYVGQTLCRITLLYCDSAFSSLSSFELDKT